MFGPARDPGQAPEVPILVAGPLPRRHRDRRKMKAADMQSIGDELAIKWDDGSESYVKLEKLRRHCPCAGCQGETDIMGNLYKSPDRPLPPSAFQLRRLAVVGGYGVQPLWGDGHGTGIFSFDYLRRVANST
jgi:DUF971 family protein